MCIVHKFCILIDTFDLEKKQPQRAEMYRGKKNGLRSALRHID